MSPREDLHLDSELIALRALGERPGTPDENAAADRHLAGCGLCRSEVDELAAIVRTARRTENDGPIVEPPPAVWESITRELGSEKPAPVVVSLDERRPRRRMWLPVAAAACAGVVIGGAVMYGATSAQRSTTPTTVVAAAALEPLDGSTARGSVQVVSTGSGDKVAVDVSGLAKPDGFYEVWLLDAEGTKLDRARRPRRHRQGRVRDAPRCVDGRLPRRRRLARALGRRPRPLQEEPRPRDAAGLTPWACGPWV